MALGCAFIFVVFMWLWRRHARKKRQAKTKQFALRLERKGVWRRRLARFAELFTSKKNKNVNGNAKNLSGTQGWVKESEFEKLRRMREEEAMRHAHEMSKLESAYAKSLAEGRISRQPSIRSYRNLPNRRSPSPESSNKHLNVHLNIHNPNRTSAPSLYSQVTGLPRSGPEPKQPTKDMDFMNVDLERGDLEHHRERDRDFLASRFSVTTAATSIHTPPETLPPIPTHTTNNTTIIHHYEPPAPAPPLVNTNDTYVSQPYEPLIIPLTDAEAYASVHKPTIVVPTHETPTPSQATSYWIVPATFPQAVEVPAVRQHDTGSSSNSSGSGLGSRNPFRKYVEE